MITKEIKRLEKKYSKLVKRYTDYKNQNERKLYLSYKKEAENIRFDIYSILIPYLEEADSEFAKLSERNKAILALQELKLKAYKYEMSIGECALGFVGKIRTNGYIYATSVIVGGTSLFERTYNRGTFATKFKGSINCIGVIELSAIETKLNHINNLPTDYSAVVSSDGTLLMFATETKRDRGGRQMVGEIVGNPFASAKLKEEFFINRAKIIQIIDEYRKSYLVTDD